MWDTNNAYLVSPCSDGTERPALRDYLNNTLNNNPSSVRASVPTLQTFLPMVTASQSFSIPENSANGTLVGTISGTKINSCTTLQNWTISSGNSASAFILDAATGAITVTNGAALNFATKPSYTLTVNVGDGTLTSADQTVTVNVTKSTSVAVAESNGLKIYPNPSTGIFTIELNELAGKTTLRIFDSGGKIVFQKELVEKKVQVNQNLAPGVYLIKIFNDKGIVVEKLTVQ